jgi:hypothetical protein
MKPKAQQAWMIWFHPRDRKATPGYGRGFVGSYAEAVKLATDVAGNTYTFTIKGASPVRPNTTKKRHNT